MKIWLILEWAAVSCSLNAYRLGGLKMGLGLTGKLGRAWVGAWMVSGVVHGCLVMSCGGLEYACDTNTNNLLTVTIQTAPNPQVQPHQSR